ncbi:MAG: hypothetical protein AAF585_23190 [Verrucomicrobiota bacterium]
MNSPKRFIAFAFALAVSSCWSALAQDDAQEKPSEAALALKALMDFVTSETWEDAAKLALDGDKLKERMTAHYERFEWKAMDVDEIRYDRSTRVNGEQVYFTHDFEVKSKNPDEIPVLTTVVQVGEKFYIDWEIFSQLRDQTFEWFIKDQITDTMSFRVSAVRGVALGDEAELPLPGGVERLRVRWRPGMPEAVSVFTGKDTEVGKVLASAASWQNYRPFRVEVRWAKEGEFSYMELTKISPIDFKTPSVVSD